MLIGENILCSITNDGVENELPAKNMMFYGFVYHFLSHKYDVNAKVKMIFN